MVFVLTKGNAYCLINACAGAHTRVETGICFGIGTRDKKSCYNISSRFMRSVGDAIKHCFMKSFA
jgi:hypothetical protein